MENVKKIFLIVTFLGFFILQSQILKADTVDVKAPCHTINLTGTNVSCFGGSNGTASVSISGGSGNFSITWSNGATGVYNISGLPAGYYDVYVVDNTTGCSAFDIINITEPPKLKTTLSVVDVDCYGAATGDILMSVSGGTLPYSSYAWSNSVSTQNNMNVIAGNYSVVVTDNKGCQANNSATVSQPAQALGSAYTVTDILCTNDANGNIDVTVWGGTAPYSYNWNSSTYFSQDLSNIPAGTYNLTIEDHNHCLNNHSIVIDNPPVLDMTNNVVDNLCFGETNGQIDLTVVGGTAPYYFEWANSQLLLSYDTHLIEDLQNETYYVTVTDEHGCQITGEYEITSPSEIITDIVSSDVSAFGGSDGQIDLTVSGGVFPYDFLWSNGITSEDNDDVPAGFYEVTITDLNGCEAYASVNIYEPLEPLGFSYITTDASCYGASDGEIFAFASGGTEPYLYSWSSGSTLSYLVDLSAGTYILTITDANNVEFTDSVEVFQPDPFSFSTIYIQPTCFGFDNGELNLEVIGGTAPYEFFWYDSDYALAGLNQNLVDIQAGDYSVRVLDSLGCIGYYSVSLEQPEKLIVNTDEENVQCKGGTNGSIHTDVTGGTLPYNYFWSNSYTTPDIINIPADTYYVIVTDDNGCFDSIEVVITEPDSVNIVLYPTEVSCIHQKDGYVLSSVTGGSGGYDYFWSNSEITENIYQLDEGEYSVVVTDIFGCTAEKSTYVEKNNVECLDIPSVFSPNGDGINDEWVIHNIELYPDCVMLIFSNWGRIVFESNGYTLNWDGSFNGNPLPSGTYYYTLSLSENLEPLKGTVTIVK